MARLPPLNVLRFFEAAARHGSFIGAAGELHVTAGAVSQRIHLLEDQLGVALFERGSRGVVLTEAGRRYASQLRKIFNELIEATDALVAPTREVLVIGVTPRFATKWLLPKLSDFQANAKIEIEVRPSLSSIDFVKDRIDVAIRHGRPPWPGLCAHLLLSEILVPVCSPRLLNGTPPLRSPSDLRNHKLLSLVNGIDEWPIWLQQAGINPDECIKGGDLDSLRDALDVAAAGLGIALGRLPFVADELRSGNLVAPFDLHADGGNAYYLVYPEAWTERPKISAFRHWILGQLDKDPPASIQPPQAKQKTPAE